MACPVRSAAAQVRCAGGPSPKSRGHAAEGALVDLAVLGAAEGHAVVLELVHGGGRVAAEVFDGVLVAEPVGALHGVVHVPAPVVGAHVAERRGDAALRRNRVRARREHLGDARRLEAGLGAAERRAQARAARADDNDVVAVIVDRVGLAVDGGRRRLLRAVALVVRHLRQAPKLSFSTAKIAMAATPNENTVFASSKSILAPSSCT